MKGVSHSPCHCSWFACTRKIAFETKSESCILCHIHLCIPKTWTKKNIHKIKMDLVATERKSKNKIRLFFVRSPPNVLSSIVALTLWKIHCILLLLHCRSWLNRPFNRYACVCDDMIVSNTEKNVEKETHTHTNTYNQRRNIEREKYVV